MGVFYVLQLLNSGWGGDYSFRCQPVDYSNNPKALRMLDCCWLYFFSKFTEFFDTVSHVYRYTVTVHRVVLSTYGTSVPTVLVCQYGFLSVFCTYSCLWGPKTSV